MVGYKNRQRQEYMRLVSDGIVKARPELAGKIEWDSLVYFFLTDVSADSAVRKYLEARDKK